MLAGDENIQLHLGAVERLLRVVCEDDEYPWFVSDEATIFDVSTASETELTERIAMAFGHVATAAELKLPLWQLATTVLSSPG